MANIFSVMFKLNLSVSLIVLAGLIGQASSTEFKTDFGGADIVHAARGGILDFLNAEILNINNLLSARIEKSFSIN